MPYETSDLERMIGESREKVDSLKIDGYPVIRHLCSIPLFLDKVKILRALDYSEAILPKIDEDFADRFGAELKKFMEDSHTRYCPVIIEEKKKHGNVLLNTLSSEYEKECYLRYIDRTIYVKGDKVIFGMPFLLDSSYIFSLSQIPKIRPPCYCTV